MQAGGTELIGKVIDRYRVVGELGSGTMGHVYEAEHVELRTRVALKVLHPHHHGSEAAARFLREGKTLGLFRHRNIVELLEVGRAEDGSLFLATELVRGVSLRDVINNGHVEPRRALAIARQVIEALGAAHAVGVVHRDVKPENIMLADGGGEDGTDLVKVLDFGVAKLLGDTAAVLGESNLTQAGLSVFGSPSYIAPEVALGQQVDPRTDLYSAGVVLYEALTGRPPFDAPEPQALLRLHMTAPVPPLQEHAPDRQFTPQLEYVVTEALAKSPDLRFRSAAEMVAAIDAARLSLDEIESTRAVNIGPAPAPGFEASPAFEASPTSVASPAYSAAAAAPSPAFTASHAPLPVPSHLLDNSSGLFGVAPPQPGTTRALAVLRANKMIAGAVGATLLIVIVLAIVLGGDDKKATAGSSGDASTYLALGHERFAAGRRADALGAYERAIRISRKLASSEEVRANVVKTLETRDAVAGVIALELMATQLEPRAHDELVAAASSNKVLEVRRRAVAIAEREGLEARIDRVESWSLDLQQATSCDERKAVIEKLAGAADKRAVAALKRVRVHKCVEKDATEAIARIERG